MFQTLHWDERSKFTLNLGPIRVSLRSLIRTSKVNKPAKWKHSRRRLGCEYLYILEKWIIHENWWILYWNVWSDQRKPSTSSRISTTMSVRFHRDSFDSERFFGEIFDSFQASHWDELRIAATHLNSSKGKVVFGGKPGDSEMMRKTSVKLKMKLNNFRGRPMFAFCFVSFVRAIFTDYIEFSHNNYRFTAANKNCWARRSLGECDEFYFSKK